MVVSMNYNLCRWAFREIPPLYPPPGFPLFLPCCFLLTSALTPDLQPIRRVHSCDVRSGHTTRTPLSLPAPTRFFPQSGTQLTYQETLWALSSDLWQLRQSPPGSQATFLSSRDCHSSFCWFFLCLHCPHPHTFPTSSQGSPSRSRVPHGKPAILCVAQNNRRVLQAPRPVLLLRSFLLTSHLLTHPSDRLQGPQDTRRTREVAGALPSGGRVAAFHGGFAREPPSPSHRGRAHGHGDRRLYSQHY